jgi:hypothetical protein
VYVIRVHAVGMVRGAIELFAATASSAASGSQPNARP